MFKFLNNLIFVFIITLFPWVVNAEIVDPNSSKNSVLERVAHHLDSLGIDVRYGSNARTQNPTRPQLTPLSSFQTSVAIDFRGTTFTNLFIKGLSIESALFAVDNQTGVPFTDPEKFQSRWKDVKQNKRIFISFNKADVSIANKVVSALNSSGYSTFIFTGSDVSGNFNAIDTANYFRQAEHKFVLDTLNSRASSAIALEAMIARNPIIFNDLDKLLDSNISIPQHNCCKLCTYNQGVLISCGKVTCGRQCEGAR